MAYNFYDFSSALLHLMEWVSSFARAFSTFFPLSEALQHALLTCCCLFKSRVSINRAKDNIHSFEKSTTLVFCLSDGKISPPTHSRSTSMQWHSVMLSKGEHETSPQTLSSPYNYGISLNSQAQFHLSKRHNIQSFGIPPQMAQNSSTAAFMLFSHETSFVRCDKSVKTLTNLFSAGASRVMANSTNNISDVFCAHFSAFVVSRLSHSIQTRLSLCREAKEDDERFKIYTE